MLFSTVSILHEKNSSKILLFIALFAIWFCFSGYTETFFIVSGIISCLIAVYCSAKMGVLTNDKRHQLIYAKPLSPKYILWLIWLFKEIIVSSLAVSIKVWQSNLKITPILTWIDSKNETDIALTTYANSITLTPGTVCVDIQDNHLLIHALVKENIKSLKTGDMDKRINKLIEG